MNNLSKIVDFENGISDVYRLFYETYKEDKEFWYELYNEKQNQIDLLVQLENLNNKSEIIDILFNATDDEIAGLKEDLISVKDKIELDISDISKCYNHISNFEKLTIESNFQNTVYSDKKTSERIVNIIIRLNHEKSNHITRIDKLISEKYS